MKPWTTALADYPGDPRKILTLDPGLTADDDATILFTSGAFSSQPVRPSRTLTAAPPFLGTTGMPKGVLSTQRQFLTNILNVGLFHQRPRNCRLK